MAQGAARKRRSCRPISATARDPHAALLERGVRYRHLHNLLVEALESAPSHAGDYGDAERNMSSRERVLSLSGYVL